ncbi:type II secretion system protein N [Marinobacter persicus]|uniref:type II secretion system protein N n=1 Tax=Marinobacter persicus TaxID=930118 RepID=UPI001D115850|nr:type II secretion system protein N [Marinobacter persicus]
MLAAMALAGMLTTTIWQVYQFWQQEENVVATESVTVANTPLAINTAPATRLADLELFGAPVSPQLTASPTETANLPSTNLRLTLRGALAADGTFPGSALVEDQTGKTEAYLVGDTLPGNARLKAVLPNRVIIERDGVLENLLFPETDNQQGLTPETVSNTNNSNDAPLVDTSPSAQGVSTGDQTRREEVHQRLQQLREQLQDRP